MTERARHLAIKFLQREWNDLSEQEKRVVEAFSRRGQSSRNVNEAALERRTFADRVADRVAAFGGSWTFILIFVAVLVFWVILNSFILMNRGFEPYIPLNLFLSMLAAAPAPIIMMSQNRQAAKDRRSAEHDYEINLKAELEVSAIQEKLDEPPERKSAEPVAMQREQIRLLQTLSGEKNKREIG